MDICLWDKCNNKCSMCTNPDRPWLSPNGLPEEGYDYEILIGRIKRLKEKITSSDAVILTGGEPTLHPRFLDVFRFVCQNFPQQEIRILTNGRRFFYKDFTKSVLEADNLSIAVSLYGPTAKINDGITRTKNSFEQTTKGLENLLLYRNNNQIIEIRTVISQLSYQYLGQILDLIKKRFSSVDRVILIFMEIEGQADKNFKTVGISYSQVRPYLEKLYPLFSSFKELRLYHFPLCALKSEFWPFVWRTLPAEEVAFVSPCKQCQYKKYCLGIHKGYLEKLGGKEFNPIKDELLIQKTGDFYHPIKGVDKK